VELGKQKTEVACLLDTFEQGGLVLLDLMEVLLVLKSSSDATRCRVLELHISFVIVDICFLIDLILEIDIVNPAPSKTSQFG
jgi:hypothetical protein